MSKDFGNLGPGFPAGVNHGGASGASAPYTGPPPDYNTIRHTDQNHPGLTQAAAFSPPVGDLPQADHPPAGYQQEQGENQWKTEYTGPENASTTKGLHQTEPTVIVAQPVTSTPIVVATPPPSSLPNGNVWRHGIFGCFDNCNLCLLGYFCPCYVIGKNAEAFGESCGIYGCCSIIVLFRLILQTVLRGKIRERAGINGSILQDCCYVYWCTCCALIQETNELRETVGEIGRQ